MSLKTRLKKFSHSIYPTFQKKLKVYKRYKSPILVVIQFLVVTKVEDELGKASLISFDPIYTPETKRSPPSPVDVSLYFAVRKSVSCETYITRV
jgi:hypothetical protein